MTDDVLLESIDVNIHVSCGENEKMVKMKGGFKGVSQEGNVFRPHLSLAIL